MMSGEEDASTSPKIHQPAAGAKAAKVDPKEALLVSVAMLLQKAVQEGNTEDLRTTAGQLKEQVRQQTGLERSKSVGATGELLSQVPLSDVWHLFIVRISPLGNYTRRSGESTQYWGKLDHMDFSACSPERSAFCGGEGW